ncbi:ATP-binding protein [Maricaulis sp.]|uniref:ATP-binding protein n=1 Tax=Maricaulis sp. TaxID=1486257 RepID=UPI00262912C3|nr:ATP-binding protein [Maricaulis sp.]
MAETAAPDPKSRKSLWSRPISKVAFWVCGAIAIVAFGAAVVAAGEDGWQGFVYLSGLAAIGFLVLYAIAAGETAGRNLRRKIDRNRAPTPAQLGFQAMEGFPEPVLITDRRGAPRWGNKAYHALAKRAGGFGQSFGLPTIDRIWAGSGGGDGVVYRLARAAARGDGACELLPPLDLGEGEIQRFHLEASSQPGELILWRLVAAGERDAGSALTLADWCLHAPVALFSLRANGEIANGNATLRDWLGLAEGASFPPLKDVLTGDGAKAVILSRGGEGVARIDARMRARDGIESPVALVVEWTPGDSGMARVVMYGLSATGAPPGVTQAMAGAQDRPAGRTMEDMFANAPFGVVRLDGADPETAIIEDVNPALVQLSGGQAIPGIKFCDLFNWDDGRSPDDAFAAAMAGSGDPAEAQLASDDKPTYVHLAFAPARGGKRVAYVIDVTAWKEMERQFSQSNKMQAVGQLAGGVAHDFNNLLTAVRLNCDELLNRHPVGDPDYSELQSINQTVARAAGLVRKLLAFSRKQTFRMETLDIGDLLSDVSVLLRQIVEETVRLDIVHGRDLPMIKADKGQLETAIINLAANARDAMRDQGGGSLTVKTSKVSSETVRNAGAPNPREGDWLAIAVTDEGHGMDAATLEKIFEPFFTTKEAGKGTGLGLATVYGIVKQSGGFLFAESEVGKGTTFTIYLPGHTPTAEESVELEQAEVARTVEKAPEDLSGRGRILLVEDEDAVRAIAAKTLAKRGYDVVEACDGEEAYEILEDDEEGFDLLISDVVMPGLDGPGLLEKARDMLEGTRVVFISGYAAEQFSDTLSREQGVSFLPKPFTLTQLAERVKEELGERGE